MCRLRRLQQYECGICPSWCLRMHECDYRVRSQGLSRVWYVPSVHTNTIRCMTLDTVEYRYVLSAGADGRIVAYDMSKPVNTKHFQVPVLFTIVGDNEEDTIVGLTGGMCVCYEV